MIMLEATSNDTLGVSIINLDREQRFEYIDYYPKLL